MKHKLTIIQRTVLVVLLTMSAQFLSAQVTIAQWNGYTATYPDPHPAPFLATGGISLNDGTATLGRDATVTNASDFTVNADGIASTAFWNNVSGNTSEKYWIATFKTTGYENLTVTSKQRGSNTGPKDFKLQYRVGTGEWADVTGGTIVVANDNYVTGILTDLALPVAMENQSSVSLRWLRTSTNAINGSLGGQGTNRLDVVVKGTAKIGVVDPQIIISRNNLKFFTKNQEETFTVTAEHLTNVISVASSSSSFLVDPTSTSLPSNASDVLVKVIFTGAADATATLTLTSGELVKKINLTAIYMPSGNNGTEEKPFTVSECKKVQGAVGNPDYYWIQGYIVGVSDGGAAFTPVFGAPFAVHTNILLASASNKTAEEDLFPVQLIDNSVREELNLRDNAANLGEYVKIEGTLEPYFGRAGHKNARAYEFTTPPVAVKNIQSSSLNVYCSDGILYVKNSKNLSTIEVYSITGNLLVSTQETKIPLKKGLYIVKINSQTFKVINN